MYPYNYNCNYYPPPQYLTPPMYNYTPYMYSNNYYNNTPYQYDTNQYYQPQYNQNDFYQQQYNVQQEQQRQLQLQEQQRQAQLQEQQRQTQLQEQQRQARIREQQRQTEKEKKAIVQSFLNDYDLINKAEKFVQGEVQTLQRYKESDAENDTELEEVLGGFLDKCKDVDSSVSQFKTGVIEYAKSKEPNPKDKNYAMKKAAQKVLFKHSIEAVERIEEAYDETYTEVRSRFQRIRSWIAEKASKVYNAVKNTFKSVWRTFKSWLS